MGSHSSLRNRSARLGTSAHSHRRGARRPRWQTGAPENGDNPDRQDRALVRRRLRDVVVDCSRLAFSSLRPTSGCFGYLLLLLVAEAVDGLAKASVYSTTGKVIDELGAFERFCPARRRKAQRLHLDPDDWISVGRTRKGVYRRGVVAGSYRNCAFTQRNRKLRPQPAPVQHPLARLVCSYGISVGPAVSAPRATRKIPKKLA